MATVISKASELYRALEVGKRSDDSEFYRLRDGSPEWMTNAIHTAHGDMLPDDWKYQIVNTIAGALAELDKDASPDDIQEAIAEIEPPVYTWELCDWLASGGRVGYVDDAISERGGISAEGQITEVIQWGYLAEVAEVANLLCDALAEVADQIETCDECGADLSDGEGWNGLCGNCADAAEDDDANDDE